MNIIKLFRRKYYYYQLKFEYKEKSGQEVFSFDCRVRLKNQSDIVDKRKMNKLCCGNFYFDPKVPNHLLCNGYVVYQVISYIGSFEKREVRYK